MVEYPVGDFTARLDPLNFIELPMDAEINAAFAVLLGGLAEAVKRARNQGSRLTILVYRDRVEFIRNDCEVNIVGSEKVFHRLEQGAADAGMAGGVRRKWRGKVGPVVVVGGGAQWLPGRIALSDQIGIA